MENHSENKDYSEYFDTLEKQLLSDKSDKVPKTYTPKSSEIKKKSNRKAAIIRVLAFRCIALMLVVAVIVLIIFGIKSCKRSDDKEISKPSKSANTQVLTEEKEKKVSLEAKETKDTVLVDSKITSDAVLFIDTKNNSIVAKRNEDKKMYPASTTKIMTLLVAVENITDYDDTFQMTYQITDPLYKDGATVAGFSAGEVLNMNDLIYGTILPSGGDAAIGLAIKIAGSEKAFVELMNKKAEQLGLKSTHFTNCTGLFDKNHFTTAKELAIILRAAMQNPVCKKVLSAQKYTTSSTNKHPNGLPLENTLFKYMYGTEPEHAVILGGKTGFVNESGYCIASFGEDSSGNEFVCVTLGGKSRWPAVFDQINIYKTYTK